MAKPVSPTIPRWQLGKELQRLRDATGASYLDIATLLGCSESKIRKIESGDVGIARLELLAMLDRYGVTEETQRDSLMALAQLGKQRGWWSSGGQLPYPYAAYIGLETAASISRTFELAAIPGLCQTEAYARAVNKATDPGMSAAELDRQVKVRMTRQNRLTDDDPLQLWAIIDESAILREVGSRAVMRDQLRHLVDLSRLPNVTIQVLPLSHGEHPGTLGPFIILEFPPEVRSPVVFTEGLTGSACLDSAEHVARCNVLYNHLTAAALSEKESLKLITKAAGSNND